VQLSETKSFTLCSYRNKVLNSINLLDEYDELMKAPDISQESRTKLSVIYSILSKLPSTSSAALTSPDGLIDELFTHVGSKEGTLVRMGMKINIHQNFEKLDVQRLKELLENAFGKRLDEGNENFHFPFSIFHFPFSIFHSCRIF